MPRSSKKKHEKGKKVGSLDDWQECSECHIQISSNDADRHFQECLKNETSVEDLELSFLKGTSSVVKSFSQSFIKNEVFYGKVEALQGNCSAVLDQTFMKVWENIVFMNPATMRKCNILHQDNVFVKGKNYFALYIAFPLRFVKNSAVSFANNKKFKIKENVIIQPYREPVNDATEIIVSSSLPLRKNEEPKRLLFGMLCKTFVCIGMKIFITYFGCTYEFTVQQIHETNENCSSEIHFSKTNIYKNIFESEIEDICDLSSLNLSNSFNDHCNKKLFHHSSPTENQATVLPSSPLVSTNELSQSSSIQNDSFKDLEILSSDELIVKYFRVSSKTVVSIHSEIDCINDNGPVFEDICGLNEQINFITNYIEMFLHSEKKAQCGILMLTGPSGTGKSLVLDIISNVYKIHIEVIHWYKLLCSDDIEEKIRNISNTFETALKREPSILIIDEFNYLCPAKDDSVKQSDHTLIIKKLSSIIEKIPANKKVLIIAAANNVFDDFISHISGKMYDEVKFPIPSPSTRRNIFEKMVSKRKRCLTPEQIVEISECAHGFTGKEFDEILNEAETWSFQRLFKNGDVDDMHDKCIENVFIEYCDVMKCMKQKKTTIIKDQNIKADIIKWSDIGGMDGVKEKLKQVVEWPLKCPEVLKSYGIAPSRGVLMYGPPGCSKTMIAKALANECGLNFIAKKSADLFNKWVGESEKAVRDLFSQAKAAAPCIIFLDEIDALVSERGLCSGGSAVGDRIVTSLLTEIDGIEELNGIILIAATNRPDMLDDALTRNGRINHFIYVPLPDERTREEIFKIQMKSRCLSDDIDLKQLAQKTHGYTGAEVVNICNETAMNLLLEDPTVQSAVFRMKHFEKALSSVLPRTTKEMLDFYENFNSKFYSNR